VSVESVIVARLLATSGVTDIVGSRIRPLLLRQSDSIPGIAYTTISNTPVSRATGTNATYRARVQLDCFASTYTAAKTLEAAVIAALDNYSASGTTPPISSCHLETVTDLPPDDTPGADDRRAFGVSLDFILWHGSD